MLSTLVENVSSRSNSHPLVLFDITNMSYEQYLDRYHQNNFMAYQEILAQKQMEFMNNASMMGMGPMGMMGMMGPPMGMHMGHRGARGGFRGGRGGRGGRF
jgi:hypothetical protein